MRRPPNTESRIRELVYAIQQLIDGRNNASGTVTLAVGDVLQHAGLDSLLSADGDELVVGGSPTVISGETINEDAAFLCFPQTASAAVEYGAGTMFATVSKGSVTIHHGSSSSAADRTFRYAILGG